MTTDQVLNLIAWYHNDERQLLLFMASLIGTGIAMATLIGSSLEIKKRIAIGAFCGMAHLAALAYSLHLAARMESIRHALSGQVIAKDLPIAYINSIVGTDWNMVPILTLFFSLLPMIILVSFYLGKRFERVRMPDLNIVHSELGPDGSPRFDQVGQLRSPRWWKKAG